MRCLDGHHLSKSCSGSKLLSNKQGSKKLTGFNKNIEILEEKKKNRSQNQPEADGESRAQKDGVHAWRLSSRKVVQQLKARGRRLKSNVTCDTIIQPGTSEGWTRLVSADLTGEGKALTSARGSRRSSS